MRLSISPTNIHQTGAHPVELSDVKSTLTNYDETVSSHFKNRNTPIARSRFRATLRQWQMDNETLITPEPAELGVHENEEINHLPRPEAAKKFTSADPGGEEPESFVNEFDRIAGDFDHVDQSYIVLRRGDLVELPYGTSGVLAIFIRMVGNGYQYYTVFGKSWLCRYRNATFVVPKFVDAAELEPMLPYLPSDTSESSLDVARDLNDSVPRDVTAPFLQKMADFQKATETAYRAHSSNLDNAHKLIAHQTDLTYLTLEDVTTKLTGIRATKTGFLPFHLLYAVSNSLLRGNIIGFSSDPKTYSEYKILIIESRTTAALIERVQRWIRAYQEMEALEAGEFEVPKSLAREARTLKEFLERSRTLIDQSRELRISAGHSVLAVKPEYALSSQALEIFKESLEFTKEDRDFIAFMVMSASSRLLHTRPHLRSMPSAILRATNKYVDPDSRFDIQAAHTFLVEIGVMQPYENPFPFDRDVTRPDAKLDAELSLIEERIEQGGTEMTAAAMEDSMKDLRKDWRKLLVICVDSSSTVEVDDGISVEPVAGVSGEFWLHSHIAHISAFTSPDHVLGRQAQRQNTSLYTTDANIPMLPRWVAGCFSVAPGSNVLTFSSRVNSDGEILESRIQPGTVRNVVRVNYETLDHALGFGAKLNDHLTRYQVGESISGYERQVTAIQELPSEYKEALETMYKLSLAMSRRRPQTPFNSFALHQHCTAWGPQAKPAAFHERTPRTHARFSLKNPSIELTVNTRYGQDLLDLKDQFTRPSNVLVQEMMLLAGRSAADWCAERSIPIPYHGTRPATDGAVDGQLQLREQFKKLGLGEQGWNRKTQSNFVSLFALRFVRSTPVEQKMLGFQRYAKVTSPLRRFYDLVAHWQIDAALKYQAGPYQDLLPSKVKSTILRDLPYSERGMDKLIRLAEASGTRKMKYIKTHQQHWIMQCLARAHYLKEAALPKPLTALIGPIQTGLRSLAQIQEIETPCQLSTTIGEDGNTCQSEEIWEVRIDEVRIYGRILIVVPVRRIKGSGEDQAANGIVESDMPVKGLASISAL